MLKIEYLNEEFPVYDITVEDNHNFFANDILVHNCAEILEYTEGGDNGQVAVCNLASISLSAYVYKSKFDYKNLEEVAYQAVLNLNKVIDRNYYPTQETYRSNMKHRPVGLGVQGLANVFAEMKIAFDSNKAKEVNKLIFETIYWGALNASCDLAEKTGAYESFEGSPASKGILQFDMWNLSPDSTRYDWEGLKQRIIKYGLKNSLLLALMPTASTSQILGNNESFEPFHSNIFLRRTISGEFAVVNRYLVEELIKINLWNDKIRYRIIGDKGSVQNIVEIPEEIRDRFKTIWEIKQKDLVEMAADRGKYICQTQSMNLYIKNPNFAKMTSALFYGWEKGLKTGVYYCRTSAATEAIAGLGINQEEAKPIAVESNYNDLACSLDNPDACEACGS